MTTEAKRKVGEVEKEKEMREKKMKWKEKSEEEEKWEQRGKPNIAFVENKVCALTFCILNGASLNDGPTAGWRALSNESQNRSLGIYLGDSNFIFQGEFSVKEFTWAIKFLSFNISA